MVGTPSSNIYISATRPQTSENSRTHRPQHTWLISVEPHKRYIPMVPRHSTEPTHFLARRDESSESYRLETHSTQGIIGTILLAEGAKGDSEAIRKVLEKGLHSSSATTSTLPSEQTSEDDSDRWIRRGIHVLQHEGLVEACDVGELMTFAHAYVAQRGEGEAPSLIAYPGLHKDHAKKGRKNGFWLSAGAREEGA